MLFVVFLCYCGAVTLLARFATQTLDPSRVTPAAFVPTLNVPRTFPLLARSLVTLLLPFATQMLNPSNATPAGFYAKGAWQSAVTGA